MEIQYYPFKSTDCGIYAIVCWLPGSRFHFYIGSTKCFEKRRRDHFWVLRRNQHHCRRMQNIWNKYGSDVFAFWTIEQVETEHLHEVEQGYLNRHYHSEQSLNEHPTAQKRTATITDKNVLKRIYSRKKSTEEKEKIALGQRSRSYTSRAKKRFYDLRLAHARDIFLDGCVPPFLSFEKEEKTRLVENAKLVYNQWPRWVPRNLEKTENRLKQRHAYKQWLLEQGLWYDARSDSWTRKKQRIQIEEISRTESVIMKDEGLNQSVQALLSKNSGADIQR